jgi:hypothetical protein
VTGPPRRLSFVPQIVAGLGAAAALFVFFTLAPRATRLAVINSDPRVVWGAYHVHSKRSDGSGSVDDIAAAAARAGLRFVILTDHGDASRPVEPPQYRHGVLCIDAAEISTAGGHVVALGLAAPAPFPLAGEAADVIEDIHRFGGWAVAAHPDSPKDDLRWRGPNTTPYDALEWLNIDSEWRDEKPGRLAATFARYLFRGPETIASLFQRPTATLRRWDSVNRVRRVFSLAAVDAHARLAWGKNDDRTLATIPAYEQTFRTVQQAAILDRPLSGDGVVDRDLVLSALRAGRSFSSVTAYATPARLSFFATTNGSTFVMGDTIDTIGAKASWHAHTNDNRARLSLVHNGVEIASGRGVLDFAATITAGPYRVEVYRFGVQVPWVISNPIFAGAALAPVPDDEAAIEPAVRLIAVAAPDRWNVEKNSTSSAVLTAEGTATRFVYALGPGAPYDQFAAMSAAVDSSVSGEGFDRVQFTIRADRPTRLSVQLRLPASPGRERWRHSVYADSTPRAIVVRLRDFQPADFPTTQRPIAAHVRGVLFVVDTLNNRTSSRGTIWVTDVKLGVGKLTE